MVCFQGTGQPPAATSYLILHINLFDLNIAAKVALMFVSVNQQERHHQISREKKRIKESSRAPKYLD